ncbi:helix-turn-helix domain-containing protein [Eggerthellaceae bacterium zg-893]|nr:helix-turn-helix domain-containing protein [Eggerthellaceae bacterium zg-893]
MEKSDMRNNVARRIKELRAEQNITQEAFALMTGINRSYLADIEKGNRNFGIDTLSRIIGGFGISPAEFFSSFTAPKVSSGAASSNSRFNRK